MQTREKTTLKEAETVQGIDKKLGEKSNQCPRRDRRRFQTRTGCYEQGAIRKQEEYLEVKNRITKITKKKKSIEGLENKVKEVFQKEKQRERKKKKLMRFRRQI